MQKDAVLFMLDRDSKVGNIKVDTSVAGCLSAVRQSFAHALRPNTRMQHSRLRRESEAYCELGYT